MMRRFLGSFLLVSLSVLAGCDAGNSSGTDTSTDATPGALRGCDAPNPKTAPGGYYTNGATVCTAAGTPHLFHGVDRPSMEWDSSGEWANSEGIPRSDFDAMASWHANVVRIALNQDFWLAGAALYDPNYAKTVDDAVHNAEAAGMDVILDLHWSDRGDRSASQVGGMQNTPGHADQQPMADQNSVQFWQEVAGKYKGDGHVLFELYNEPHDIPWQTWLSGGQVKEYQAVGMQQLYDAVRGVGADNVVIAGGLSYAFDLSQARNFLIQGYNVMYATHPYYPQDPMQSWDAKFGYLAAQDIAPVIATEFGDTSNNCTGDWNDKLTAYADARQISWTAWAWWAGDCHFPSLISDWDYTPSVQGAAIKAVLMGYEYQPAGNPSPAGGSGAGGSGAGGGGGSAAGGKGGAGGVSPAGDAGEGGTGAADSDGGTSGAP
ncbi:MAG: glycoside hydrolase family 5 protein [Myxococcales bacterium]